MPNFKYLVFIDDDYPSNIFHEIILNKANVTDHYKFYLSALEALEDIRSLQQKDESQLPEIIFLDINMPRMNGWEFIEEFESIPFTNPPRIVVLSTSTYIKDKDKALGQDAVHTFISKPLEVHHFQTLQEELTV